MSVLCQAFGRKTFRIRLDRVKQKAVSVRERTTASVLEEAAEGKDGWIPVWEVAALCSLSCKSDPV